ncbi:MAG TPA: PGF-CTERM sorting domain-containing protein [Methanocorpusculum sp.]|nr:PGF-CTERM sorting domain-containing protein [Methanocorpusculum sp.]
MNKLTIVLLAAAALLLSFSVPAAAVEFDAEYTVSAGDELKITSEAQGNPGYLRYYVFGTNYFTQGKVSVDDAQYTIKLNTNGLSTGEYIMIIQHPMYDKLFNVQVTDSGTGLTGKVFATTSDHKLSENPQQTSAIDTRQNANAAFALEKLINLEYHDDRCIKVKITVTSPALIISSAGGVVVEGDDFVISGATNLKPGTVVTVEIVSTVFSGVSKTGVSDSVYLPLEARVVKGYNGVNTWSVTAHNPHLAPGEYRINAVTPNDGPTDTGTFTVIARSAAPAQPAQTAQIIQTPLPTQAAPVQTATAVPASPGFGILACAAALGCAAAFLRRK